MARRRQTLDGIWNFYFDADSQATFDNVQRRDWQTVSVPAPWQTQIQGLETSTGSGWYRRTLQLDGQADESVWVLHFGAAYHYAQVWLNGHYLGDHEGGWLPFEFLLSPHLLQSDNNELVVRVVLPSNDPVRYPDFPASEILHGKQSWYGPWGGLWQSVWIEERAPIHIQYASITMDAQRHSITPAITLSDWQAGLSCQIDVMDMDGQTIHSTEHPCASAQMSDQTLQLDTAPELWSPDHPYLYTIRVRLLLNGALIDETKLVSGFRTIEARDGQIFLNGKPFYMRGALDQDYYPDTLASPPSAAFLEDQFRKAKAMGLNTLRYHIKIADPMYYELADRMGILLWVDLPTWTSLTDVAQDRIRSTLSGMIERDRHHPSIAIWTIVNEDWGTDLVHNASHRAWLRGMYKWAKELDPSRLVVDNSPCQPNFHVETDIADYHYYFSIPDHRSAWDAMTERIAHDPSVIFSPHGDAVITGQEPIIVSEFGNWGLPDVDGLLDEHGKEPWWFETGSDWAEGIVYPHGVKTRFQQWQLGQIFGTWQHLTEAMQWQQFRALKHEIESIRSYPQIQGYVITELTDIHWENNGLMDMQRHPRIFADSLARLNANTLVIAKLPGSAFKAGDSVYIELMLSRLIPNTEIAAAVEWELGSSTGSVKCPAEQTDGITALGSITVQPDVTRSQLLTLRLYVRFANGERVLSNEYPLAVYKQVAAEPLTLAVEGDALRRTFEALGYHCTNDWQHADVVVTDHASSALADYVQAGGRVLCVASHSRALDAYESGYVIYQKFPFARLAERQSTIWNGDWVASFSWLVSDHVVMSSGLIDDQLADIMPDYVLCGFLQSDFPHDVSAGIFVGWLHRHATLLGYRRYHNGLLSLTTFKLDALDVNNPAQRLLVHDILHRLRSG